MMNRSALTVQIHYCTCACQYPYPLRNGNVTYFPFCLVVQVVQWPRKENHCFINPQIKHHKIKKGKSLSLLKKEYLAPPLLGPLYSYLSFFFFFT